MVAASVAVAFLVDASVNAGVASVLPVEAVTVVDAAPPLTAPSVVQGVTSRCWVAFVVFRPLLTTTFQTPSTDLLGSAAATTAAGAGASATVAWLGCGATFLPRHTFEMYPEAPHDQQE